MTPKLGEEKTRFGQRIVVEVCDHADSNSTNLDGDLKMLSWWGLGLLGEMGLSL